jgi:predicted nuclease with TOPRIM domain
MRYWRLLLCFAGLMIIGGCQNKETIQKQRQIKQAKEELGNEIIASGETITDCLKENRKRKIETENLKDQMRVLESKIAKLVGERKTYQGEIDQLRSQLSEVQRELERLKDLLFGLQRLDNKTNDLN